MRIVRVVLVLLMTTILFSPVGVQPIRGEGVRPAPRLQTLSFSVDATRTVNAFNAHMLGVAHGNWDHSWGKPFAGEVPGLGVVYQSAGVGLIRYAGGLWANWVGWERSLQKTPYTEWRPVASRYFSSFQPLVNTANTYTFHYGTDEIDSLGDLARQTGADVMIQVNISQNDPYMWADLVHYANIEKGYDFKYWELGNEIDLECSKGAATCISAAVYEARAAAYIAAMKAVDPGIIIVGGASSTAHDIVANNWVDTPNLSRYLVSGLEAGAGALSYHWYTDCNADTYENIFTWSWSSDNTVWQNSYSRSWSSIAPTRVLNEIINPTRPSTALGITELNTDACDFSRAPQNGNQIAAVWYADVLGRLAYNGIDFVTWYEGYGNGSNSGYPSVAVDTDYPTQASQIYLRPVFNTLFMYGNFFGDRMVQVTGPRPDTVSLWAATDTNQPFTLKLMAVNLGSSQTALSVNINGFAPTLGYKYELTSTNPLDRSSVSNGPNHTSTINGYKLLSTNIAEAKNRIPQRSIPVAGNPIALSLAPYSVTAVVLQTTLPNTIYLPVATR